MAQQSKPKKYVDRSIVIIGLIASILTIYIFISGKPFLSDHLETQKTNQIQNEDGDSSSMGMVNEHFVYDSENNKYETVKLANKIWLRENLACGVVGSHSELNNQKSSNTGLMYTWEAAKEGCSCLGKEWRVPTDEDWKTLAGQYGGFYSVDNIDKYEGQSTYRNLIRGGTTGFDADLDIIYWSSTEETYFDNSTGINFSFNENTQYFVRNDSPKSSIFHVRCLKDL